MAMGSMKGKDAPNGVGGNVRVVLVDFFNGAAGLVVIDDGVRLDASALDDGAAVHLARYRFDVLAGQPVHGYFHL